MLNAIIMISHETSNYFYNVLDVLKDIRWPWTPGAMLPPEYFVYG